MLIRGLILLLLLGVLSSGVAYFAVEPRPREAPEDTGSPVATDASLHDRLAILTHTEAAGTEVDAQAAPAATAEAPKVRDVTPANMTAAPPVRLTLTRVEPLATPMAPPSEPTRTAFLRNPLFTSAGILKVGDREIHLSGIEAPDADARCGEGSESWPCGMMARAALRRFIRGRAIVCDVPAGAKELPDPVRCTLGEQDLSKWLVSQGWARSSGDGLSEVEKTARDRKLGMWSAKRPDQTDDVAGSG